MKNTDFFFPRLFARIELWRRLCSRCPRSVSTWQTSQRTTCYSRQSATSKAAKWTTFSPKLRISTMRWCVSRLWNVKLYTHTALCINTERWISVCLREDDGVDSSYYIICWCCFSYRATYCIWYCTSHEDLVQHRVLPRNVHQLLGGIILPLWQRKWLRW